MLEGPGQISRLDDCALLVLIATVGHAPVCIECKFDYASGRYKASGPGRINCSSQRNYRSGAWGLCHSIQLPAAISQRQLEIEAAEEFGVYTRVIKMDI
jgi:hypothetical protein